MYFMYCVTLEQTSSAGTYLPQLIIFQDLKEQKKKQKTWAIDCFSASITPHK